MTGPEGGESPVPLPVPAFDELTRWQLQGLVCAWCPELLFPRRYLRLATVRDATGGGHDLFVCEPCVLAAVEKALADAS
ncbi:hypothetical protein E1265_14580 [Streptomyces sp. 8K308]|uniref:hypothetical protein n=1 Tax=Streptomyces sp. 8K308 TaxID=2530388 RepID=UPI0010448A71|nr:hypothetical protein [Streptomyces sp. 8K308]TDC22836.1 hypothetical protein E1265_14580 [Streptomyces sp. 8K308]